MLPYPQPLDMSCCCQFGPLGPRPNPPGGPIGLLVDVEAVRRRNPAKFPNPNPPNSTITGTGPVALAGVVTLAWIFTSISGYEELSTCPTRVLVIVGIPPLTPLVDFVTFHST